MRPVAALTMLALLGGCAIPPQAPGLLVVTAPPGASCTLVRRGRAVAVVGPTPAIARGIAAGGILRVACVRRGFEPTSVALPSPYPERVDIVLKTR